MKGEFTFGTAVKISRLKPEVGELRISRSGKSAVKITSRRLNVEVGKSELVRPRAGYSAMKPGGRNWSGHVPANLLWFYGVFFSMEPWIARSARLESESATWDVGKVG